MEGISMPEVKVLSEVTGNAWKIVVTEGQAVEEGDELMIAEAMKMEIPQLAPEAGTVKKICVEEGAAISEDDLIFIIET
jgi:acetyl-CoA carboxylase biotin carboxyl carrier protein